MTCMHAASCRTHGGPAFVQLELFQRAARLLNSELLVAEYIIKRLDPRDNVFPNFPSFNRDVPLYRTAAEVRLEDIREAFGYGEEAHENWAALMDYIDWYRRSDARADPAAMSAPPQGDNLVKFPGALKGFNLTDDLFDNDDLLEKVQKMMRYEGAPLLPVRTCLD